MKRLKNKKKILTLRFFAVLSMIGILLGSSSMITFAADQIAVDTMTMNIVQSNPSNRFFGNQLSTAAEIKVYQTLEAEVSSLQRNTTTSPIYFSPAVQLPCKASATDKEILREVTKQLQRGIDAYRFDHPEIYWITGESAIKDITLGQTEDGYLLLLSAVIEYTPATSNYAEDDAKIDAVINQIVTTAQKEPDDYRRLKMAHDMLAQYIVYSKNSSIPGRSYQISGGLVDRRGVCESYAKSFKLIADRMGYETILVGGTSHRDGKSIPHMWNYVKVQGQWYGVDVTWDDQANTVDDYFLVGRTSEAEHFGNTCFKESHVPEGTFHTISYKPFQYPKLSETAFR